MVGYRLQIGTACLVLVAAVLGWWVLHRPVAGVDWSPPGGSTASRATRGTPAARPTHGMRRPGTSASGGEVLDTGLSLRMLRYPPLDCPAPTDAPDGTFGGGTASGRPFGVQISAGTISLFSYSEVVGTAEVDSASTWFNLRWDAERRWCEAGPLEAKVLLVGRIEGGPARTPEIRGCGCDPAFATPTGFSCHVPRRRCELTARASKRGWTQTAIAEVDPAVAAPVEVDLVFDAMRPYRDDEVEALCERVRRLQASAEKPELEHITSDVLGDAIDTLDSDDLPLADLAYELDARPGGFFAAWRDDTAATLWFAAQVRADPTVRLDDVTVIPMNAAGVVAAYCR